MFEEVGWIMKENVESENGNEKNEYDPLTLAYLRPSLKEDTSNPPSSSSLYEIAIVRRFDFSAKLQRMITLTKNLNEPYFKAFCKGSPEKIKTTL